MPPLSSTQAEERKDRHNHHDQADDVDNAVHVSPLCWRASTPKDPEDTEGRWFDSVLIARPGYYNQT